MVTQDSNPPIPTIAGLKVTERDDLTSYDDVVNCIRTLPLTWCPAILKEVVLRCDSLPVFNEGMLLKSVERILQERKSGA